MLRGQPQSILWSETRHIHVTLLLTADSCPGRHPHSPPPPTGIRRSCSSDNRPDGKDTSRRTFTPRPAKLRANDEYGETMEQRETRKTENKKLMVAQLAKILQPLTEPYVHHSVHATPNPSVPYPRHCLSSNTEHKV